MRDRLSWISPFPRCTLKLCHPRLESKWRRVGGSVARVVLPCSSSTTIATGGSSVESVSDRCVDLRCGILGVDSVGSLLVMVKDKLWSLLLLHSRRGIKSDQMRPWHGPTNRRAIWAHAPRRLWNSTNWRIVYIWTTPLKNLSSTPKDVKARGGRSSSEVQAIQRRTCKLSGRNLTSQHWNDTLIASDSSIHFGASIRRIGIHSPSSSFGRVGAMINKPKSGMKVLLPHLSHLSSRMSLAESTRKCSGLSIGGGKGRQEHGGWD